MSRQRVAPMVVLGLTFAQTGCASLHYKHTPIGTLSGRVTVEWYKPNLFIYRPDPSVPLSFVRSNGEVITPEKMLTDGGSIPRAFWVFKNYSPWGYGPAFVVHDWLFHVKNCSLPDPKHYTLADAAKVMSEIMKTLMESPGFDYGSKSSMYLMYEAVQTAPAREAWEHGLCQNVIAVGVPATPADAVFILDFTGKP